MRAADEMIRNYVFANWDWFCRTSRKLLCFEDSLEHHKSCVLAVGFEPFQAVRERIILWGIKVDNPIFFERWSYFQLANIMYCPGMTTEIEYKIRFAVADRKTAGDPLLIQAPSMHEQVVYQEGSSR